jgi:hypothetical protein
LLADLEAQASKGGTAAVLENHEALDPVARSKSAHRHGQHLGLLEDERRFFRSEADVASNDGESHDASDEEDHEGKRRRESGPDAASHAEIPR